MDEEVWLRAWDPKQLLDHFSRLKMPRKRRLFACACCRRVWDLMTDERSRRAVVVSEMFADGLASREELAIANREARQVSTDADATVVRYPVVVRNQQWRNYRVAQSASFASDSRNTTIAFMPAADALFVSSLMDIRNEFQGQANVVRDIFGNPFRPVAVDPAWLTWNHATVPAIARHVYDDRAFHDLPILADALEDAGCTDPDILAHCRAGGEHVRGCWVVDLILGKS
jgi:hypothetical protein